MIGRTATGWAYECRSEDFGATWTELTRSPALRNPEAQHTITPQYLHALQRLFGLDEQESQARDE